MAAKEIIRLVLFDELLYGFRPGMEAFADPVELGAVWRRMADQHERADSGDHLQAFGELRLGIFARRVKRRRARIAKSRDMPSAHADLALVKIVQTIAFAEIGDLRSGLMVAGK